MKLGVLLNAWGWHIASWRHPDAPTGRASELAHYIELAKTAERGKFDLIFMADSSAISYGTNLEGLRRAPQTAQFEPVTLLSALAVATSHIGLVGSVTTTYSEPYTVARMIASLDHLSAGRAGWNLVTSANQTEAYNYGRSAHAAHADRYDRATEFARVVLGLWDSWDDGAYHYDKPSGIFLDLDKMHVLDHRGKHFQVRGPLDLPRPPQGHPVIAQAGSSEAGKELAAETADVVFTAQQNLDDARAFYADLKGRLPRMGRAATSLKILPGLVAYVAPTRAAAEAKREEFQALIHPEVGLSLLTELLGNFDIRAYPLDSPFPQPDATNAGQGRLKLLSDLARRDNLTIRQLYLRIASARGHVTVCGTASDIADVMEEWTTHGGADGFNLIPPYLPGSLDSFVDEVVPELQRRGLFRREYEGGSLRENLGVTLYR